ncbi:MAG: SPOR domain-containing protein [Burkholderiales bacterium]|nr:SPOR domain-containing protein [Burkholderiales bacterium]
MIADTAPAALDAALDAAPAPAASSPDEDVTTTLYRAAIGPVSNAYYLPVFTRFDAEDRAGIRWNTAASLSTFNWLLFRRLWGTAVMYVAGSLALALLIVGIVQMMFQWSDTLIAALALGYGLILFVVPGLFGNALFYANCRKRMSRALVGQNTVTEACAELTREAATRRRAIVLLAVNIAAALVAVFLYLQTSEFSMSTQKPHSALETEPIVVGGLIENTTTPPLVTPGLALPSAATASAAASAVAPPSSAVASAPAPATVASAVATAVTATAAKPLPAASVASKDVLDKPYFINVGLFAVPSNAAKAHARLLDAQLPSVTRELKSSKGLLTRVRVGPFASREGAQDAVVKIQALKLEAVIVQP